MDTLLIKKKEGRLFNHFFFISLSNNRAKGDSSWNILSIIIAFCFFVIFPRGVFFFLC